jgi:hypothetical protein
MLRIPQCIDNRDVFASGTHFCQRLSKPQGLVRPERLGKLNKFTHYMGYRNLDFPACSIVPYPLRYRCVITDLISCLHKNEK